MQPCATTRHDKQCFLSYTEQFFSVHSIVQTRGHTTSEALHAILNWECREFARMRLHCANGLGGGTAHVRASEGMLVTNLPWLSRGRGCSGGRAQEPPQKGPVGFAADANETQIETYLKRTRTTGIIPADNETENINW